MVIVWLVVEQVPQAGCRGGCRRSASPDPCRRAGDLWAAEADRPGPSDFCGLQAQITRHLVIDGEALVIPRDTDDGLRVQVLPPEHLDESRSSIGGDGLLIVSGVEFDAKGRRAACHVLLERPLSAWQPYAPAVRIDAAAVLHVVHPIGAPWHPSMRRSAS